MIPFNLSKQLVKYVISGGTAAIVDFSALYILTELAHIWYVLSVVAAFLLAFLVSFSLQKLWTFKNRDANDLKRQITVFLLVSFGGLSANVFGIYFLVEWAGLWYMLAKFIIAGIVAVITFIIYKFVIFERDGGISLKEREII